MNNSINAEKTLDKTQHPFMIKSLSNLGVEEMTLIYQYYII